MLLIPSTLVQVKSSEDLIENMRTHKRKRKLLKKSQSVIFDRKEVKANLEAKVKVTK